MKNSTQQQRQSTTVSLLLAYITFGAIHELTHLITALWLLPPTTTSSLSTILNNNTNDTPNNNIAILILRFILGRCLTITYPTTTTAVVIALIQHSGWIVSLLIAIVSHVLYKKQLLFVKSSSSVVVVAAYITALEGITTDLFGFVPHHHRESGSIGNQCMTFFCGNFGVLLLNSSWLSIDGGRTALDVLEKMVNVTMMRGAQSGGVVTFEPIKYSQKSSTTTTNNNNKEQSLLHPPILKGIRSRVVNAKRTDLSQKIKQTLIHDNCSPLTGNLRGYNKSEYTVNDGGGKLVRGFFGHTRFATSSKASFEGTHPHQWSGRREYRMYSFGSASSSLGGVGGGRRRSNNGNNGMRVVVEPRVVGVENYITHNGDFEFYRVRDKYYDVMLVQGWLENVLETPMPATVDSAAIAGMIDLLRTQGSFALSLRYALCLTLSNSKVESDPAVPYPTRAEYEEIAKIFESALRDVLDASNSNDDDDYQEDGLITLEDISSSSDRRAWLASIVVERLRAQLDATLPRPRGNATGFLDASLRRKPSGSSSAMAALAKFVSSDAEDDEFALFIRATVDAFFDNDLFHSTRIFLEDAKGSFGIMVCSSVDAHRQVCFAARGQTLSIAFYPRKGLICYGSEQAAVKAGLNYENPGGSLVHSSFDETHNAVRLDLDDLGGEIALLDWGYACDAEPAISPPNRNLPVEKLMNGSVNVVLLRQSMNSQMIPLSKRLTLLENNEFIKPLLDDVKDPVLADIHDIPRICYELQQDWRTVGLNRMTAWNLANCIRERMKGRVDGSIKSHGAQIDILVTGCEVSLWVAEQFVSDLQKSFPYLFIRAVSSNKLLGLFGQELVMPCTGFPYSQKSMEIKNSPIVMIISHSGGTFGPLACSNLLQSFSSSIFAVTSEWDTQVGKQLRSMYSDDLLSSRIFSTGVGVRPAEPCSVSVVATHQLLTNIFEHICVSIISEPTFRHVSGAVITELDLQILERCNQENIKALEEIVAVDKKGGELHEKRCKTEQELRSAGDLWADHILEVPKAYIMSFVYIMFTVTSGWPLVSGLATAGGLHSNHWAFYITRFLDACLYFWLPQINITILRLIQGRNLRHRMVGRTVVIGDCPWVSQCADAFLSKIFACSYSIAGLNVLSANPADHLVHRHTHRVVRGSLLVCGRPDGRLPALTSLEASTCLSVNQASSIQSIGGTCESITIGHNKSKLPLSKHAIYLKSHRPLFLSEKVLDDIDAHEDLVRQRKAKMSEEKAIVNRSFFYKRATSFFTSKKDGSFLEMSLSRSRKAKTARSSASLLGAYVDLEKQARKKRSETADVFRAVETMIKDRQGIENARRLFNEIDSDGNGVIGVDEFIAAYQKKDPNLAEEHLRRLFKEADIDDDGMLQFDEFVKVSQMPNLVVELTVKNRDSRGLTQVQASKERYFGEELRRHSLNPGISSLAMSQSQYFSMELYESRIASMQRFVAMTVMFHQMGSRVQSFFPKISFGYWGYRMDRTHSIMRIASTASPVSGADVRERIEELRLMLKIESSVALIARTWRKYSKAKKGRNSPISTH